MKTRDSQGHQASHHLLLHIFILYCYASALVYKNALFYIWRSCHRHSDTTPYFTTPAGAATSIAPIKPELAERVLLTLLSLEATLKINGALRKELPLWKNVLKMVFGEKDVFQKNLGMGLPCPRECLQRKVFEKKFC